MPEYLIKKTAGLTNWPAIPQNRLQDVLEPRSYGAIRVDGWGDLHLVLGGCEMVFSGEDAGWHVMFGGDTAGRDTDALISQVARQVQDFTGEHTEWIRIT